VIEAVFGCPVFNRYGCREVGIIASECPAHDGLHVAAEGLVVEVLCDGRPARPGELGAVVVTDLLNRAMPLIRYRVGDAAVPEDRPCACGRGLPRLRSVTGRVADFLVGADGRLVAGPFLAHALVAARPSLGQVQIRQDQAGVVHFRVRPGPRFRIPEDLEYLREVSHRYLGERTDVGWELVERLDAEPSGKFLFCKSAVTPAFARTCKDALHDPDCQRRHRDL
jgi:phenylacetate-CoA ligase